ncbi:MAG: 4Fe-4S binding protein [Clostridiales bacterium]|nr:4Fe-4S binding protein [Clostridiales bacterium]
MIRKIIHIDEDKCNGCGLCANACKESAIAMVNGKAKLIRDDYCDGLGNCLPVCPTGAISFIEREAAAYDEESVKRHQEAVKQNSPCHSGGCPGSRAKAISREAAPAAASAPSQAKSQLMQWPVQMKLLPVKAPFYENANLLVAADCTAYAYGDFHNRFIRNRIALIGCPKLDEGIYAEKLTEILKNNEIKSITVVRMEVPCCGGIVNAVKSALMNCGKLIPWQVVTISTDGEILEEA